MEAVIEELNFYISGQFCLEWYLQSCFMKPESGFHFPAQSPTNTHKGSKQPTKPNNQTMSVPAAGRTTNMGITESKTDRGREAGVSRNDFLELGTPI